MDEKKFEEIAQNIVNVTFKNMTAHYSSPIHFPQEPAHLFCKRAIETELRSAYAQGKAAGLEEAAKIADKDAKMYMNKGLRGEAYGAHWVAKAIEAALEALGA